jgi:protein-tyrosine phosphatase
MSKRTTKGHPLRIDEARIPGSRGAIGITFCPGKKDGIWDRDLASDLDVIAAWAPLVVLTLIEEHEFSDVRFETQWQRLGSELSREIQNGSRVLVHCRGGLGRAGSVAALLLIGLGIEPQDAIRRVRAVRPGAIETSEQERYVLAHVPPSSRL